MSRAMRKLQIVIVFLVFLLIPIVSVYVCFASPSVNFYEEGDDIYDDWCVCRTNALGADGFMGVEESETETEISFRPLIAFESLGEHTDVAYSMGEQFVDNYPDREQRAEEVFEYVRDTVTYMNDIDQFDREEYAVNADELASIIQQEGIAYGDCEDFAVLLATMYQGAGFRSAIVICPGHAAVLVYLPGYDRANVDFSLEGEPGWVWAEATGNTNPLGWFPQGQIEEPILAYEISSEDHIDYCELPGEDGEADGGGFIPQLPSCFIATAAYGTPMAEEIQILREFRDEYLVTNPMGKGLVEFYYRVSPPMAEFITDHPGLKPIVRASLVPVVAMSTVAVSTTPAEKAAILCLLVLVSVALAIWATRRRSKGSEHT